MVQWPASYSPAMVTAFRELGDYLRESGYGDCVNSCLYMPYRHGESVGTIRGILHMIPKHLRLLVRFLYLGDSIKVRDLSTLPWARFVGVLEEMGVVENESQGDGDYRRLRNLCCRVVDGLFLFVTPPTFKGEIVAYFGEDSIKLNRHVQGHTGERALDVCCGSGIQSLTLARRGFRVTGIDIQAGAIRLAEMNSHINGLEDRCEFQCADVRKSRLEGNYDLVVSNPPLLPVAPGVKYPLCGDGGASGNEILVHILRLFDQITSASGKGVFLGFSLGTESMSLIEQALRQDGLARNWNVKLFCYSKVTAAEVNTGIAKTSSIHFKTSYVDNVTALNKMCSQMKAPFAYSFLLKVSKAGLSHSFDVIRLYERRGDNLWYV